MEMPVSYQLTNGKCIRLKNSQRSKSYYGSENENNNITLIMESKSSNKSQVDCNLMLNKNEKDYSLSKGNNSLISYGKSNSIYPMKFVKHHQKKLMKEITKLLCSLFFQPQTGIVFPDLLGRL